MAIKKDVIKSDKSIAKKDSSDNAGRKRTRVKKVISNNKKIRDSDETKEDKNTTKAKDENSNEDKKADEPKEIEDMEESTSSKIEIKEIRKDIVNEYDFNSNGMPIHITIYNTPEEYVPIYEVSISAISSTTERILEQIRKKLIKEVSLGMVDITNIKQTGVIEERFQETISILIKKYFPDVDDESKGYLTTYLVQKSLGMGNVEILMNDNFLEEITINRANEPIWVYHKKYAWLKTNIVLHSEDTIRHYSSMVARKVGRQITILDPLLDAHLKAGDRVNATIMPISVNGNTMTIRRFSRDPFTITHFLKYNTMSLDAASLIWLGMQYEMSAIIAGGTASGKTSTLNVLASFFPPNQRIISIEDTRELRLPKFLHWVPMSTRVANTEGKGKVSMGDLLVNALRMRPDRILVGEVRRKQEAETLFEAIHTGHSCYATFHANNTEEAINRLTNAPIEIPKTMLPAISMIITQFRNRRTGKRRTFQIAEILPDAKGNVLMQYNAKNDTMLQANKSKSLLSTLELYTGNTQKEIKDILEVKKKVLQYLIKQDISTVDSVGRVMAEYYTNYDNLMTYVNKNKKFEKL